MVKFLDITEEEVQGGDYTNEELDILLKAHNILISHKLKKGKIITAS